MITITYHTINREYGVSRIRTTSFDSMLESKQYLNSVFPKSYKILDVENTHARSSYYQMFWINHLRKCYLLVCDYLLERRHKKDKKAIA